MTGSLKVWNNEVVLDADINGIHSFMLNNLLNIAKDGADTTNQNQLVTFMTLSSSDVSTSTDYVFSDNFNTVFAETDIYDDFSDTSVDSAKWSWTSTDGETPTEVAATTAEIDSGYVRSTSSRTSTSSVQTCTLTSYGSSDTMPMPSVGSDGEVVFWASLSGTGPSGNGNCSLQLKGKTSGSWTLASASSNGSVNSHFRLVFTSTHVYMYKDDMDSYSSQSLSGFAGDLYLYLYANSGGANYGTHSTQTTLGRVFLADSSNTVDSAVIKITETVSSTSDTIIPNFVTSGDGSFTISHSFDGGSNYSTITNGELMTSSDSGTSMITKFTVTGGALDHIPHVRQLLYYYD